jgi:uncharacterized repeat protein (TIGR01451 family)
VSDGYGVDRVTVRLTKPDGNASWLTPTLIGPSQQFTFTHTFDTVGRYSLGIDAWDDAGNRRHLGPFGLTVLEGANVADLSLSSTASAEPAITSYSLTYTLSVENQGTSDATNTEVEITLPPEVSLLTASPEQGTCGVVGGVISCSLNTILDSDTVDVAIRVYVPLTTTGKLLFTATASSDKVDFDQSDDESLLYLSTFQPITGLAAGSSQPTVLETPTTFTATVATGTDVHYVWSFGNGITATGRIVSHTYAAVGRYTAVVTATNAFNYLVATTSISVDVPIASPFLVEGFDGDFPPEGWQRVSVEAASDDFGWDASDLVKYDGLRSAHHTDLFGMYDSWLVTPQVTPTLTSELVFWQFARYEHQYFKHSIWISVGGQDPRYDEFVQVVELGPASETTWEEIRVSLDGYVGKPIYIAFRYAGDFADEWYVDDVHLTTDLVALNDGPTPFGQPTTLQATVGTGTNIEYVWDVGNGDTASGAEVVYTYPSAGTFTAVVTAANSVSVVTATTQVNVGYVTHLPVVMIGHSSSVCIDDYEPDDVVGQATSITTDGVGQDHTLHQPGDVDWIAFEVVDASVDYVIETYALSGGADTVIYLYDSDGQRLLDWNDDAEQGTVASRLHFNPYHSGPFYLKIVQYNPNLGDCDMGYSVHISPQP